MKKNILISILSVIAITTITVGVTYAYYASSATGTITGSAEKGISSSIAIEAIKTSNNLVPLLDNKIGTAIANNCVDKNSYDVCDLYKVTISNTGDSESLYGYLETTSSTYQTNNLKFQIFQKNSNNSYTSTSNIMTVSKVANEIVYFKSGQNNLVYTSNKNTTSIYYVAIWLSDTDSEQSVDYFKSFNGAIGIEVVGHSSAEVKATLP